jgi:hypothetical protein
MKVTIPKFIIIRNITFAAVFCYIVVNHAMLTKATENTRSNVVQYTQYNPFQLLAEFAYWSVNYIIDFSRFRQQELEMTQLSLQVTALMNDFQQIKTQNEELKHILSTLKNMEGHHTVKHVVKLHYSVINHGVREVYFRSGDDIPLDGLVVNRGCLIGRIFKKDGDVYHILTTEDSRFRLPVYAKNSKVFGMLHGNFNNIRFMPFNEFSTESIESMEEVLSASFNERFTENISIGNIIKNENQFFVKMDCMEYYNYALVL